MRKFILTVSFFVVLLAAGGCLPPGFVPIKVKYRSDRSVHEIRKILPNLKKKKVFGHFFLRKYGVEGDFMLVTDTTSMVFYPFSPLFNTPVTIDSSNFPEFLMVLRDSHRIEIDSAFLTIGADLMEIYGKVDGLKFESFFHKGVPEELTVRDSMELKMTDFKEAGTDRFYPTHLLITSDESGAIDARIDSILPNPF